MTASYRPPELQTTSDCDITFFVPCLNEAANIERTIATIRAAVSRVSRIRTFEIAVVDDGCTDNTAAIVEAYAAAHPEVRILLHRNPRNLGLGRSYAECAYSTHGEHYMMVAGDNAEPEDAIVSILSRMGDADIVIPFFGEAGDQRTWLRRKLSLCFTGIVNLISNNSVPYYNGPMIHRRLNVVRWHSDTHGFAYQAQIVTRLLEEGATFCAVETPNNDRQMGASSAFRFENFISVCYSLLQIFLRRVRYSVFYRKRARGIPPADSGGNAAS